MKQERLHLRLCLVKPHIECRLSFKQKIYSDPSEESLRDGFPHNCGTFTQSGHPIAMLKQNERMTKETRQTEDECAGNTVSNRKVME